MSPVGCKTERFWAQGYFNLGKCGVVGAVVAGARRDAGPGVMLAFLLFWVPFPFGFPLVSCRFSLAMSCPFGRGVLKHGIFSFQVRWPLQPPSCRSLTPFSCYLIPVSLLIRDGPN